MSSILPNDEAEDRYAALRAETAACDKRRQELQVAHPLDVDNLVLVLHSWPEHRGGDRRCFRCGDWYLAGTQVHLVIGKSSPAVDTAVCTSCVEAAGSEYGRALIDLRDALEALDTAFSVVPDNRLHAFHGMATTALELIGEAYRAAEQDRYIATAADSAE